VVDDLKAFLDELKALRKDIRTEGVVAIAKKSLRERAETLGSKWFSELSPKLATSPTFSAELLERYSGGCARLIKLSAPNNLKTSYLDTLDRLIKPFRDELILPSQKEQAGISTGTSFNAFFAGVLDTEENTYLQESLSCAKSGYYRASAVLGWCAAIDRIHRKIEDMGFVKFNVTSVQMASQTKGRFKRFNQPQAVNSISELREVFDTTILWIIEGMGLIDSNQHTRLRSCFDMRCHGAHPGDAPITEYNLLSFFSDIDQIVINNSKFATQGSTPDAPTKSGPVDAAPGAG
jgi:hypothetical protein